MVIENEVLDHIIPCLELDSTMSVAAIELLYEIMKDRSGWNTLYFQKLSRQRDAIPFLVRVLRSPFADAVQKAEEILMKLCDEDEENVINAAKVNWYEPLIYRINEG